MWAGDQGQEMKLEVFQKRWKSTQLLEMRLLCASLIFFRMANLKMGHYVNKFWIFRTAKLKYVKNVSESLKYCNTEAFRLVKVGTQFT